MKWTSHCKLCEHELTEPEDGPVYCWVCTDIHPELKGRQAIGRTYHEEYPLSSGPFDPERPDPNVRSIRWR